MDVDKLKKSFKLGKLKKASKPWQKYLINKTLMLMQFNNGSYDLILIEGESGLDGLCKYAWENDADSRKKTGYESLEAFIEECNLANDGFGFEKEDIEITYEFS